jgi:hypothetical protein
VSAPPELAALQGFLSGALRRTEPIAGDPAAVAGARVHVAGNERLRPEEQADIYRRQFWLRHFEALREDYPGLSVLLGDGAFDDFVTAYLVACPPRSYTLRDLGDEIVAFADGYERFGADTRAAALEMVRYEHALVDLFDGPEPPPLDPQKLASLPAGAWETARIVLHPLLVRMRLSYPLHTFRPAADAAVKADADPPPFPAARPVSVVLFRRDGAIHCDELEPEAYALLAALAEGEPLVPACDRIAAGLERESPMAAEALGEKVGSWFKRWTEQRWIVDVELSEV